MISTGATIEAAANLLLSHDALPDVPVAAATHGFLVGDAPERLSKLPVRGPAGHRQHQPHQRCCAAGIGDAARQACSIAPLLAEAIARLHRGTLLGEVPAPA
jgi:ribose-phosphate pyrophosphokinase